MLLFQFPEYQYLYNYAVTHKEGSNAYEAFMMQVANPLTTYNASADSHESKMVFRLAVPLMAGLFNLNIFGVFLVQLLVGLAMLWALLTLLERITQDRPTALLIVLGACFTYYGGAFLHDIYCLFDSFGYAVLIFLLISRSPPIIYSLTVVGCFLDERVLVASLMIVLWHSMRAQTEVVPQLRRPEVSWSVAAVLLGWLTYGALRLWLTTAYGLKTHGGAVGLDALRINLHNQRTALGFITGMESFWLVVALALTVLITQRRLGLAGLLLAACFPSIVGSFLVHDITRSLAYAFPMVLLSLVVLAAFFTKNSLRGIALVVTVFAMLIPNYVYQLTTFYTESIFEKSVKYLLLHTSVGS